MNCDVCNENDATVYLTQIVKGEMQKVNLCEDCAKEKGVTDPTGFALADALLGMDSDQGKGESVDLMNPGQSLYQNLLQDLFDRKSCIRPLQNQIQA